jgi:Synergist-CTERM protein sorting domain-containing protein
MRAPGNELPLPGSLPLALLALLPLSFTRRRR